jgi:hypothetical protein
MFLRTEISNYSFGYYSVWKWSPNTTCEFETVHKRNASGWWLYLDIIEMQIYKNNSNKFLLPHMHYKILLNEIKFKWVCKFLTADLV